MVNNHQEPVELIEVDKAMESWRDSGFDLSTAIGEPVDNSIEAKAKIIRIETKGTKKIEEIIIADDGTGIDSSILAQTLKLGFSTRYNERKGLGRFGVGMKLAGISQARRIDVYTKPLNSNGYFRTFLDLNMISDNEQIDIQTTSIKEFPEEYHSLMKNKDGSIFESGTLVVWSKVDRINNGGKYGNSIQEQIDELRKFLARAYRLFIDKGLRIELNGKKIELYDPLFQLESTWVSDFFDNEDWKSTIEDETEFEIDGHKVNVTVTLYPKAVRLKKGEGGGTRGSAKKFEKLNIDENKGKVSFLRNGREIYYDTVPRLFPTRIEATDRFIGVEISFPAALDEYFEVRNVKRGAQPGRKLKVKIKDIIDKPIRAARKEVKKTFNDTAQNERNENPDNHSKSTAVVNRVEQTSPRGIGDSGRGFEDVLEDVMEDMKIDKDNIAAIEDLRKKLEDQTITLNDSSWPGKELFELIHYNGKVVITLNHRHPFIKEIYLPIKQLVDMDPANIDPEDYTELARLVEAAIDILLMAYAKAENMDRNPDEKYADLRSFWGQYAAAYIRELVK